MQTTNFKKFIEAVQTQQYAEISEDDLNFSEIVFLFWLSEETLKLPATEDREAGSFWVLRCYRGYKGSEIWRTEFLPESYRED